MRHAGPFRTAHSKRPCGGGPGRLRPRAGIEVQWRVLKRLLAGRYFETVDDLRDAIVKIIQDEMKPVKVMDYMA